MKSTYRSTHTTTAMLAVLAAALCVAPLSAQTKASMKEETPGLLKKAKIAPDAATKIAMTKVPGGRVKSGEIEMEGGKLIYSFDLEQAGKKGVDEVTVDAQTGAILKAEHEPPAGEAKEKAAETAKPVKPAAVKPAASKPAAGNPAAAKPTASKPAVAMPTAAKPAAAKPAAAKPAASKPATAAPTVVKPKVKPPTTH